MNGLLKSRTETYIPLGETNAPCCLCGSTDIGMRYTKTITTTIRGRTVESERYTVDEPCRNHL